MNGCCPGSTFIRSCLDWPPQAFPLVTPIRSVLRLGSVWIRLWKKGILSRIHPKPENVSDSLFPELSCRRSCWKTQHSVCLCLSLLRALWHRGVFLRGAIFEQVMFTSIRGDKQEAHLLFNHCCSSTVTSNCCFSATCRLHASSQMKARYTCHQHVTYAYRDSRNTTSIYRYRYDNVFLYLHVSTNV